MNNKREGSTEKAVEKEACSRKGEKKKDSYTQNAIALFSNYFTSIFLQKFSFSTMLHF